MPRLQNRVGKLGARKKDFEIVKQENALCTLIYVSLSFSGENPRNLNARPKKSIIEIDQVGGANRN